MVIGVGSVSVGSLPVTVDVVVTTAGAAATVVAAVDEADVGAEEEAEDGISSGDAGWDFDTGRSVSRNDAAMADSGPLAGVTASLAKSDSLRTLAATALIALPPGGTVPWISAVVAARMAFAPSLPNGGRAPVALPEMSANSRTLAEGSAVVPWDDERVADATAACCAARAAAATNPAGVSGNSNFVSSCSSDVMMQAVGTLVTPRRRVASGEVSTSTQTGSKQAEMRATASSLASVVRSRVVLAELQLAVKMASMGRWLSSDARRAVARSGCHGTAANALAVHADGSVSMATVASRRQIREGIGIGITMQGDDLH